MSAGAPGPPAGAGSHAARATVFVCAGLLLATLPIFLVSSLAVEIRTELGFGEAALGAAVSGAFVAAAVLAPLGGRLADRAGATVAILAGSTVSVAALAGLAVGARGWLDVAGLLVAAGAGIGIAEPGYVLVVARAVPDARQGLAFGIKEAAVPAAGLVAGLALPLLAATLGWRWAFAVGIVPLAGLALLAPTTTRGARSAPRARDARRAGAGAAPRLALLLATVAGALGVLAASGVAVFVTESAVARGLGSTAAGLLLAGGSAAGIVTRVVTGIVADRVGGEQLGLVSWLLLAGALGVTGGAAGSTPLLVVGVVAAFAGGWGWSGLLFLSLVRAAPHAPATAAGFGILGLSAGLALGPVLFGAGAQRWSFGVAWAAAALTMLAAAATMRLARRLLVGSLGAAARCPGDQAI